MFVISMAWFEGKLAFYLIYTLSYLHSITSNSYLSNLPIASLIMLAYI
jgi:hypothetical protein